ncbi:MAG: polysaccharide lyase [Myxococcota bacterium]|nr:polysaccharide lyase [Myxococcota bacterium]
MPRGELATLFSGSLVVLAGCLGCTSNPYEIGRFTDPACDGRGEALVCSGFERPDLSEWDETIVYSSGAIRQTEENPRSGHGSLLATTEYNESAAAVSAEFSPVTDGDLYLRMYIYLPSEFDTMTTNVLFLGDAPAPDPFKGVDFNFEAGAPEIFSPESDPVRYTSTTLTIPRDVWFCYQVELGVSEDAGTVRISVDGQVALDQGGLDTLPVGGVHLLRAGVDWSSKQMTPFAIYLDDLVLSRSPVDCD